MSTLIENQIANCEKNAKANAMQIVQAAQDVLDTEGLDSTCLEKLKQLVEKAVTINKTHSALVK